MVFFFFVFFAAIFFLFLILCNYVYTIINVFLLYPFRYLFPILYYVTIRIQYYQSFLLLLHPRYQDFPIPTIIIFFITIKPHPLFLALAVGGRICAGSPGQEEQPPQELLSHRSSADHQFHREFPGGQRQHEQEEQVQSCLHGRWLCCG